MKFNALEGNYDRLMDQPTDQWIEILLFEKPGRLLKKQGRPLGKKG